MYIYITGAQGVDQVDGAVTEGDDDDDTLGSCIYLIVDSQDQLLLNITPQAISVIKDVMQVLRTRKEGKVLFNDALNTFYLRLYGVSHMVKDHTDSERGRKEGNVLFNDALNTFYLQLYGVSHMVKDHTDSERGSKEGNVLFNDALNTFYLRLFMASHIW